MKGFFLENIKIALTAIKSQLLRTILTVLIIAIGIMALVGILTAIQAIKTSLNNNFTSMGANSFTIRNRGTNVRIGERGLRPKNYRAISYDEAKAFTKRFDFPAQSSVSTLATGMATLKYKSFKSNPNIQVFGGDEGYLAISGYDLERGRNFSSQEVEQGNHVVIIGKEIQELLFPTGENPLGAIISVGSGQYKVIGVLKSKGSSMGFGGDKICILPLQNVKQYFPRPDMSYTISVMAHNKEQMDAAIQEATGIFRIIRKVPLGKENNFEIVKSDNLANILYSNMSKIRIGATVIGIITLLGAAIGLMNIMLVSVTERTREIGIRKAIGATRRTVLHQFLMEAIVICQLGGLFGIILGILIGNVLSMQLSGGFIIPWRWIGAGIAICVVVGLLSGIYPAMKASKLDPIEALRFE